MERTKKELQLIRSPKHPGAVFVKVKDSHDRFICKFYPYPNGKEAVGDVEHFMKTRNAFEPEGLVSKLAEACKGIQRYNKAAESGRLNHDSAPDYWDSVMNDVNQALAKWEAVK